MIIKKTLKETIRFLEMMKSGIIKHSALIHIQKALERSLYMNVFVNSMDDVYSIENLKELKDLIKNKGTPRKGSYNYLYRIWKTRNAPFPHEITGTMKNNTFINIIGNEVQLHIPDVATTKKGYNYGPIHERRKSILKATVFFAWNDIMKRIRNLYRRFIENA